MKQIINILLFHYYYRIKYSTIGSRFKFISNSELQCSCKLLIFIPSETLASTVLSILSEFKSSLINCNKISFINSLLNFNMKSFSLFNITVSLTVFRLETKRICSLNFHRFA